VSTIVVEMLQAKSIALTDAEATLMALGVSKKKTSMHTRKYTPFLPLLSSSRRTLP
jgi:hypothetical protein